MKDSAKENLLQLRVLLCNICLDDYTKQTGILSDSSIGDHIRHILEFYLLLISGSLTGSISYDHRKRDTRIASDSGFAISVIDKILERIENLNIKEFVDFEADYTQDGTRKSKITSTVGRELAYCIEHSIHHQALIKAALISMDRSNLTDNEFGVAYSTIRYRNNTCAQ